MSLVRFLVILALGTLVSWVAWVIVLTSLDPLSNAFIAPALFYLSGWLALVGTLTIAGFYLRHWFERANPAFVQIATSLRQAAVVSTSAVVLFMLQRVRALNIWTFVLVIAVMLGIEFFYWAGQSQRQPQHQPLI
jgi:hypothetical protein